MNRNVGKTMARLSPRSLPLQVAGSRGTGQPELTAIDIANALAVAGGDHRKALAVDVLCLRWWPARIEGPMRVVGYREVKRPLPPVDGKLRFYIERMPVEKPSETQAFLGIASLLARALSGRARKVLAPKTLAKVGEPAFLQRWARAVIDEYRNPHHCPVCRDFGRPGEVAKPVLQEGKVVGFEWHLCEDCEGTGVQPWGKHRRAKAVQIREATFRDELNPLHEGALALLRELEHRGARMVNAKLRDD
ncbi:TPA: hypothetical protein ACOECQ_002767 [Stenotrophomonas maltophilia]